MVFMWLGFFGFVSNFRRSRLTSTSMVRSPGPVERLCDSIISCSRDKTWPACVRKISSNSNSPLVSRTCFPAGNLTDLLCASSCQAPIHDSRDWDVAALKRASNSWAPLSLPLRPADERVVRHRCTSRIASCASTSAIISFNSATRVGLEMLRSRKR